MSAMVAEFPGIMWKKKKEAAVASINKPQVVIIFNRVEGEANKVLTFIIRVFIDHFLSSVLYRYYNSFREDTKVLIIKILIVIKIKDSDGC